MELLQIAWRKSIWLNICAVILSVLFNLTILLIIIGILYGIDNMDKKLRKHLLKGDHKLNRYGVCKKCNMNIREINHIERGLGMFAHKGCSDFSFLEPQAIAG